MCTRDREDVSFSTSCYRFLLRGYSRKFRIEAGAELESVFSDSYREARKRGRLYVLLLWIRTLLDLLVSVSAEKLERLHRRSGAARKRQRKWRRFSPGSFVETTAHDVRFALRTLRRRPLFAAVAVVTLGLGIGAATAMFSVVDGVLVKPLPYNEPSQLVSIWWRKPWLETVPGVDGKLWDRTRFTYPQYRDLLDGSTRLAGFAAYRAGTLDVATLTGSGEPVEISAGAATASLLPLLGVRPELGRWFLPGEEASRAGDDGAAVAVVSYELWQGRFGGLREMLGSTVTMNGRAFTVVGILSPGFRVHWLSASFAGERESARRDVWFPIGAPGWRAHPQASSWEVIGRLEPGVTAEQARAELHAIMSGADSRPRSPDSEVRVVPRTDEETFGLTSPLVLLFGATGLLLLVACGNIATLSMAEIFSRQHEMTTRSALGAGKTRMMRLLLTESLVLAALGSAVGFGLAFAGTELLVALAPPFPRIDTVGVDLRILGFAALLGTATAFLFGTIPSVFAARSFSTLRSGSHMSFGRRRFTVNVIALEIAMTAMLLVAGGLLTRSVTRLMEVDPGFDTSNLATIEVVLPGGRYPTRAKRVAFFGEALDELKSIPGVGTVTGVSRLPFPGIDSDGYSLRPVGSEEYFSSVAYEVGPRYLETLGVSLYAGRYLAESDGPEAPLVMVINETMARRYWPDESPLGARLAWGGSDEPLTVVGIVGDVKRQLLTADVEPSFYMPYSQKSDDHICFVARTRVEPGDVLLRMRDAVWSVDPELAVRNANTVEEFVAQSAEKERYGTLLAGAFVIVATLLAAAGVFGVTARSVASRAREMGIRMALGARENRLVGTTVKGILYICLVGTVVGLVGALVSSRLLARFLFGITPSDPLTYAVVAAIVVVVCLIASHAPARRIAKVNPVEVLRAE